MPAAADAESTRIVSNPFAHAGSNGKMVFTHMGRWRRLRKTGAISGDKIGHKELDYVDESSLRRFGSALAQPVLLESAGADRGSIGTGVVCS
jgi:hypothetical protein